MAATKMNAAIRAGMVEKSLETSGYNAERRALITTTATFAEKVRQVILASEGATDATLAKMWRDMDRFNSSAFFGLSRYRTYGDAKFNINLGGLDVYLWLDGQSHAHRKYDNGATFLTKPFKEGQKTEKRCWVPRSRVNISDEALKQEFLDIEALWSASAAKLADVTANVTAAVSKFRTVEKLLEAWPEAKDLLPVMEKVTGTALALDVKSLNAICGVPQGK